MARLHTVVTLSAVAFCLASSPAKADPKDRGRREVDKARKALNELGNDVESKMRRSIEGLQRRIDEDSRPRPRGRDDDKEKDKDRPERPGDKPDEVKDEGKGKDDDKDKDKPKPAQMRQRDDDKPGKPDDDDHASERRRGWTRPPGLEGKEPPGLEGRTPPGWDKMDDAQRASWYDDLNAAREDFIKSFSGGAEVAKSSSKTGAAPRSLTEDDLRQGLSAIDALSLKGAPPREAYTVVTRAASEPGAKSGIGETLRILVGGVSEDVDSNNIADALRAALERALGPRTQSPTQDTAPSDPNKPRVIITNPAPANDAPTSVAPAASEPAPLKSTRIHEPRRAGPVGKI